MHKLEIVAEIKSLLGKDSMPCLLKVSNEGLKELRDAIKQSQEKPKGE